MLRLPHRPEVVTFTTLVGQDQTMLDFYPQYRASTPQLPSTSKSVFPAPRNPLKLVTSLIDCEPPIAYPTSSSSTRRPAAADSVTRGRPALRSAATSPLTSNANPNRRRSSSSLSRGAGASGRSRSISLQSPLSPITFEPSSGYGFTVESPLDRVERMRSASGTTPADSTPALTFSGGSQTGRPGCRDKDDGDGDRGELPWPIPRSRVNGAATASSLGRAGRGHRKWSSISALPTAKATKNSVEPEEPVLPLRQSPRRPIVSHRSLSSPESPVTAKIADDLAPLSVERHTTIGSPPSFAGCPSLPSRSGGALNLKTADSTNTVSKYPARNVSCVRLYRGLAASPVSPAEPRVSAIQALASRSTSSVAAEVKDNQARPARSGDVRSPLHYHYSSTGTSSAADQLRAASLVDHICATAPMSAFEFHRGNSHCEEDLQRKHEHHERRSSSIDSRQAAGGDQIKLIANAPSSRQVAASGPQVSGPDRDADEDNFTWQLAARTASGCSPALRRATTISISAPDLTAERSEREVKLIGVSCPSSDSKLDPPKVKRHWSLRDAGKGGNDGLGQKKVMLRDGESEINDGGKDQDRCEGCEEVDEIFLGLGDL